MILINSLGIQDSGGITVLEKLLQELKSDANKRYLIVCNDNLHMNTLVQKYKNIEIFDFRVLKNRGFLHRIYYENIVFRKIIQEKRIRLIYNFSGSAQFFLKIPQITKVHNLLFYSKKTDAVYFQKKEYLLWLKQIFLKRVVFHSMLRQTRYVEIQSAHVQKYISDFIDTQSKVFFIKSDIDIQNESFSKPKEYDFTKRIKFLYIVGPHFEYLHKNFTDFTHAMQILQKQNMDFEIVITLTKEQLHNSKLWDKGLDKQTNFLGYVDTVKNLFTENTVLISTSVIETLGLHVVEAIQNAILAISPNEYYAKNVYGEDLFTYELFDSNSLVATINDMILLAHNEIKDTISRNQKYLIDNENTKYKTITHLFDKVLKEEYVQK
ncbi:glycosyltransferase [bacterium]|nr:glycosyltransferase [bacterium]MBU1990835.1 glycosyltransferase [bacterium]